MKENTMSVKQPPGFDSAKQRVESLAADKFKVTSLLTGVVFKAGKNIRLLIGFWQVNAMVWLEKSFAKQPQRWPCEPG